MSFSTMSPLISEVARVRGSQEPQVSMLAFVDLESRVPVGHPIRTIKRLADNLRKMGDKRPTKPASLWRSLKSFLGKDATDEAVEAALAQLIADGVVKVDSAKGASYPTFVAESGSAAAKG